MRPSSLAASTIRQFLVRNQIADLRELKQALGTSVDVIVFRKLRQLDYLSSYSHRGLYYTLREVAHSLERLLMAAEIAWLDTPRIGFC